MFKMTHLRRKPKFDRARDTGFDIEKVEDEAMHNTCELSDRNDSTWNAGMNL